MEEEDEEGRMEWAWMEESKILRQDVWEGEGNRLEERVLEWWWMEEVGGMEKKERKRRRKKRRRCEVEVEKREKDLVCYKEGTDGVEVE